MTNTCVADSFRSPAARLKGIKVAALSGAAPPELFYGRRDYYKVVIGTGHMTICYSDQNIQVNGTFLFFGNPHIPYSVEHHSTEQEGYACLFTEAFINSRERTSSLLNASIFRFNGIPVIPLTAPQAAFITNLFTRMLDTYNSDYDQKDEMLRSSIDLIIHEALQIQPQLAPKPMTAATRMTNLFLELLEKQFPITTTTDQLRLRTAQDYADALSVHVNYLNRSIKEITGKPISTHIAERITAEAKALLQHTNWSVADIAYALGFDYPTYFNNYFKRITGTTPNSLRKK